MSSESRKESMSCRGCAIVASYLLQHVSDEQDRTEADRDEVEYLESVRVSSGDKPPEVNTPDIVYIKTVNPLKDKVSFVRESLCDTVTPFYVRPLFSRGPESSKSLGPGVDVDRVSATLLTICSVILSHCVSPPACRGPRQAHP